MYELTKEQKNKILNDLKGMSKYEKELYLQDWKKDYFESNYDDQYLQVIKFIEEQE